MGAYPVPYNGGYNNGYPQAYDPAWQGWHQWGPPGYPPPGGYYYPPPIFIPYYPQPGYPGGGYPGGGQPGGQPSGNDRDFNSLRNLAANVRNVGNHDDRLDEDELEELRNQALLNGDRETANMASELMEHYDELNDEGGGIFGLFKHDVGISEDTLFDILAGVSEGKSVDSAIAEEAKDHD